MTLSSMFSIDFKSISTPFQIWYKSAGSRYCHTYFVIGKSISHVYRYNEGRNNTVTVSNYSPYEFMSRKLVHAAHGVFTR